MSSSSHEFPASRFMEVHERIIEAGGSNVVHVPTVLCKLVQEYPETIDYIKFKTKDDEMIPEVHGWDHIDYAKLKKQEIVDDLNRCIEFFVTRLDHTPTIFYTPWGANASHVLEASNEVGLKMVDCSNINQVKRLANALKSKNGEAYLKQYREHGEIMLHWWEGGLDRTQRIIRTIVNNDLSYVKV